MSDTTDQRHTFKHEPGGSIIGTKPVASHASKKVMLRAERKDEIRIIRFVQGGSSWPTEYTVVQRQQTYYGPVLLLYTEVNGEDRNFELTAPGRFSHLILWMSIADLDGFRSSWQPIAEVEAKIAGTTSYKFCEICGQPLRDIWHERYRAFGIPHDADEFHDTELPDDERSDVEQQVKSELENNSEQ